MDAVRWNGAIAHSSGPGGRAPPGAAVGFIKDYRRELRAGSGPLQSRPEMGERNVKLHI